MSRIDRPNIESQFCHLQDQKAYVYLAWNQVERALDLKSPLPLSYTVGYLRQLSTYLNPYLICKFKIAVLRIPSGSTLRLLPSHHLQELIATCSQRSLYFYTSTTHDLLCCSSSLQTSTSYMCFLTVPSGLFLTFFPLLIVLSSPHCILISQIFYQLVYCDPLEGHKTLSHLIFFAPVPQEILGLLGALWPSVENVCPRL